MTATRRQSPASATSSTTCRPPSTSTPPTSASRCNTNAAPAFADVIRGPLRLLLSGPASSGARATPDDATTAGPQPHPPDRRRPRRRDRPAPRRRAVLPQRCHRRSRRAPDPARRPGRQPHRTLRTRSTLKYGGLNSRRGCNRGAAPPVSRQNPATLRDSPIACAAALNFWFEPYDSESGNLFAVGQTVGQLTSTLAYIGDLAHAANATGISRQRLCPDTEAVHRCTRPLRGSELQRLSETRTGCRGRAKVSSELSNNCDADRQPPLDDPGSFGAPGVAIKSNSSRAPGPSRALSQSQ